MLWFEDMKSVGKTVTMTVSVLMMVTADTLSPACTTATLRKRGRVRRKECILPRKMLRSLCLRKRNERDMVKEGELVTWIQIRLYGLMSSWHCDPSS